MKKINLIFTALIAITSSQAYAENYFDYFSDRSDRSRYDLEREREELQRERNHLERDKISAERARINAERNNLGSRSSSNHPVSCPSGFTRSENKCSQAERKRGCKDMRLSNGMGCVKR